MRFCWGVAQLVQHLAVTQAVRKHITGSSPVAPAKFVEPFGYPLKDPLLVSVSVQAFGLFVLTDATPGANGHSQFANREQRRNEALRHAYHSDVVATESAIGVPDA